MLVSKIHKPTLRALAYARATRPSLLEAITVNVDPEETKALQDEWDRRDIPVPLKVLDSPYREITDPILDYVRALRRNSPRDVVTVFIPEYVVGHWWEHLLHNQSALRLKGRLLFTPGVMVTSVPWQLASSARRGGGAGENRRQRGRPRRGRDHRGGGPTAPPARAARGGAGVLVRHASGGGGAPGDSAAPPGRGGVLVSHAPPPEGRGRVVVTDGGPQSSYWRADAVEILEPAPGRVAPPCPWAGPGRCGGCDWQHASLAVQRSLKARVVQEQLARLAGIEREVVVEPVPGGPRRSRLANAHDLRGR